VIGTFVYTFTFLDYTFLCRFFYVHKSENDILPNWLKGQVSNKICWINTLHLNKLCDLHPSKHNL